MMELTRISTQNAESVYAYYARESLNRKKDGDRVMPELLDLMADCLEYIRRFVDLPPIFAVTSHYRLRLIGGDNYELPTLVTLTPVVDGPNGAALQISYELPPSESPWPNALVSGLALGPAEAAEMVRIALARNAHAVPNGDRT